MGKHGTMLSGHAEAIPNGNPEIFPSNIIVFSRLLLFEGGKIHQKEFREGPFSEL